MKYYRTYVVCFRTSTGLKYYAGKRVSKYENPVDDPYTGSGKVIKATVKKYGLSCISSIEWFDHTKETLNDAEIALIAECKEKYGSACTNWAKGGTGGNTLEYATDEQKSKRGSAHSITIKGVFAKPEIKARLGAAQKKANENPAVIARRCAAQKEAQNRPEVRDRKSKSGKEAQNRPEVRAKNSESQKKRWSDPDTKTRISASHKKYWSDPDNKAMRSAVNKKARRTSPVWHGELYQQLWELWLELGMPKHGKLQGYCKRNGVTDLALNCLVRHFNERYQNEQLQEAA